MDIKKIQEILKDEPKFRIKQVYEAVFAKFIENWDEATNLPAALREKLKAEAPLEIKAEILESADKNTIKAAIDFSDGRVETVLMRHGENRNTVCVSSQIGCLLGCEFCLTGQGGFERSLNFYEIVEQVLFFARYLRRSPQGETGGGTTTPRTTPNPSFERRGNPVEGNISERVSNIVFMGMGEPLLNYDEVMKAVRFLNDEETFNIGARKISISTVGIIDGIKKLANEPLQINLALSLHAPDDELRQQIMPVAKNNPLKSLLKAVKSYIAKTNRKVMIEYLMLDKVNDSSAQAQKLADLLKVHLGKLFMVNLISYNETQKYRTSPSAVINNFKKILEREGVEVVQRFKFGRDVQGACGQLAGQRSTRT
ncbi:MAG: 23S rRNA (adenine(2503)-C(2))-methyltransferase RlmN [Patescibacteria group bacterium]|nr:23S rRNA (adenine(2503)-C(2))-methyltransferase RlmN [Patescibacteria group bacterium]